MLPQIVINAINRLPASIIRPISKKMINFYLDKYANITIENKEILDNIKGPVIITSNHLSNSDGLVLNRVLSDISPYFVAGVKLTKTSLSRIGFEALKTVPIQPNTADIEAMKKCIELVKAGNSIFIFPEGTRSRTGELMEARKGVILLAKKCGVPIVPIGLSGTDILMPINDDDMGRETFQHADVKVCVGEPYMLPEKEKEEEKEAYNERCLNTIMTNIARLLPDKYRGIYK